MSKMRRTISSELNALTARVLSEKFRLIACSAFEWEGLPEGIEDRHIENVLFEHGFAIFFRDPGMSYMVLPGSSTGKQNVYGEPTQYRVTGVGYSREFSADEVVVIDNNNLRSPTAGIVDFYVLKMSEIERTMDVNVKAAKTPFIFTCDDKDVLSFKRIFQQIDGNIPAIFADRGLNTDAIKALQTGVKFLGNELQDFKHSVENELLTFLGLNNLPTDKKERLITDEANANNQLIQSFIDMQLDARTRCAELINEKFGLNVSVKKRTVEPVDNPEDNPEEVEDNAE